MWGVQSPNTSINLNERIFIAHNFLSLHDQRTESSKINVYDDEVTEETLCLFTLQCGNLEWYQMLGQRSKQASPNTSSLYCH